MSVFLLFHSHIYSQDYACYTDVNNSSAQTTSEPSIEGRLMEQIPIINNVGQLQKELGDYTNGVYLYSLVVDGKIITTKRLVVAK